MIDIWTSNGMQAGVEHEGFLIAQLHSGNRLAAFRSSGGIQMMESQSCIGCYMSLTPYFVQMMNYSLRVCNGKCDGGRMWLVYNGCDAAMDSWYTHIGVFRVSVSNDLDGNPVLSAQVDATNCFPLGNQQVSNQLWRCAISRTSRMRRKSESFIILLNALLLRDRLICIAASYICIRSSYTETIVM